MSYIFLYDERYGYFESIHNGYTHHINNFHQAANYKYLDEAMDMMAYLNRRYDKDYHIEVFTVEG
nr:MAG TPA: hypothetical protein [Caudoviricetes sp.]